MRVKEDPMKNDQLKPAYNLWIATCNQFVLDYDVFQNQTDTKTLKLLLDKMQIAQKRPHYLIDDTGYGSESNYRYIEDELPQHTARLLMERCLKNKARNGRQMTGK